MAITSLPRRCAAVGLALGLAALLSACFLSPGKFNARMDLKRDGSFRFAYAGEIYLVGMSQLAELAEAADSPGESFTAQPCYDDDTYDERTCSDEEIEQQRSDWETELRERVAKTERESKAMQAMFGGIDPSDPAAAEELAVRLRRQEGWKRVEYKGDGLYDVDFAIDSKLHHDFAFPTLERFPMANFFVVANARADKVVRIDAPGFTVHGNGNPFAGMIGAIADDKSNDSYAALSRLEGTFTVVTEGEVLANNTDEGATASAGGKVLTWQINKRTQTAPTALIKLAP